MKLLKVVIAVIIVVVSLGLVVFIGASMYAVTTINLLSNSVYYAQRMPHKEETEPDLVMLIENMGEIYTPKIEGIRYDNGANFIENSIDSSGYPTSFGESVGGYSYSDKNDVSYKFNKNFELEWALDKDYKKIDTATIDEKKIKGEIRETLKPILDVQSKPVVNLQWLFNMKYQDRFN
ncbi:hypothetical protein GEZ89_02870 [Streptococcus mitis]|uniref:Uncharacterized protein n=1 Tax=Streptococcus mitis TaxID=28037 RepID=A0A7X1RKP9_STRMT|nr:hypothetical protein [Streptococcus mitis]MQQ51922.1 hypothetical protein [Streptococcus mitis]